MSQSSQEREDFKNKLAHLFKVKQAICEVMDADPKRLVINKINKNVFNVDGSDLQLIVTMMISGAVKWEVICGFKSGTIKLSFSSSEIDGRESSRKFGGSGPNRYTDSNTCRRRIPKTK